MCAAGRTRCGATGATAGRARAPTVDACLRGDAVGHAPSPARAPARGEAIAPARGEAIAPARGEAIAPARGEAIPPARGEAIAPACGEAIAPACGEAIAPALARGDSPARGEAIAAVMRGNAFPKPKSEHQIAYAHSLLTRRTRVFFYIQLVSCVRVHAVLAG